MASANSLEGRINTMWGDVQKAEGNHYVPDPSPTMDIYTAKIQRKRLQDAIDFWKNDPCHDLCDIMTKHGTYVPDQIKGVQNFLAQKMIKYNTFIDNLAPVPADINSQDDIEAPTPAQTNVEPPPKPINYVPYFVIGGIAVAVIVSIAIIVKK